LPAVTAKMPRWCTNAAIRKVAGQSVGEGKPAGCEGHDVQLRERQYVEGGSERDRADQHALTEVAPEQDAGAPDPVDQDAEEQADYQAGQGFKGGQERETGRRVRRGFRSDVMRPLQGSDPRRPGKRPMIRWPDLLLATQCALGIGRNLVRRPRVENGDVASTHL
jgi:hypothetical protein